VGLRERREREKRRERLKAARDRAREAEGWQPEPAHPTKPGDDQPAWPSDYGINSLEEHCQEAAVATAYYYDRVSTGKQDLKIRLRAARRRLGKQGIRIVHAYGECTNGSSLDPADRPAFAKALNAARERGIPLVSPCLSRWVRSTSYHPYRAPQERPNRAQLATLLELADGVTLLTINDPDAEPPDDEAYLRQLAAEGKRCKPGRKAKRAPGDTKARREQWKKPAQRLHAEGLGYKAIADELFAAHGVTVEPMTVRNWLRGQVP
jgi:DNA invertase Pin-like site-specific DNA recombinase